MSTFLKIERGYDTIQKIYRGGCKMSRADEIYRQICLDILNNGFSDENLEVRPK